MEVLLAPGTLLLSVPQMLDPNFMHTVVLMVEHAPDGAYGLVVNRLELVQGVGVTVKALFPDHTRLSECDFPVHSGGPVGKDQLTFLHRLAEDIPGGHEVAPGLYLGGDPEAMASVLAGGADIGDQLRLIIGYSGWGRGQLDGELSVGSWVPATYGPALVFEAEAQEAAWRQALRALGKEGEGLSHLPPDVSWN
jgi:putative transcriptional regulator